jgi:hypothetical protein
MSKTISISGYMYESNIIDLTDKELKSLEKALKDGGDVWEANEDLQERLLGDSIINGYRVEDGVPQFSVSTDGVKVSFEKLDLSLTMSAPSASKRTSHQLVVEKWSSNGSSNIEISGRFSPDKLELSSDEITLPDGTQQMVVSASYDDEEFEFQESWTDTEVIYIIKKNGEIIEIE